MENGIKKTIRYTIVLLGCVITLLPFVWMVLSSLKTSGELFRFPPTIFPKKVMWRNYLEVGKRIPIIRYFLNSILVSTGITIGTLITTVLAAFAFSRVKFWGRDLIFTLFIATMIVPGEATLIPNYLMITRLGWMNTYKALILPWTASVFSIFLLRQYFLSIPESLYRAAKIDGCSDLRYICCVMVPLAKPALITVAMLRIINSWNEFLWPLIMTNDEMMRTLPVALSAFTSEAGNQYQLLMAAATIIILPVIIAYLCLQKYIISGIAKSGVKG